jgi:16S rRNA processing protein RimM
MTGEKHIPIGKLGKPHGISGAFRFLFFRDLKSKKKLPTTVFLDVKGNFVPFFIKSIELKGWNDGFIKFEDITTPEAAKLYSGRELFLPEELATQLFKPDANELEYLSGYKVLVAEQGEIGAIARLEEGPAQVLITVSNGTKEWMIPLVDEFIIKIDKRKKELHLQLPEGLLDI